MSCNLFSTRAQGNKAVAQLPFGVGSFVREHDPNSRGGRRGDIFHSSGWVKCVEVIRMAQGAGKRYAGKYCISTEYGDAVTTTSGADITSHLTLAEVPARDGRWTGPPVLSFCEGGHDNQGRLYGSCVLWPTRYEFSHNITLWARDMKWHYYAQAKALARNHGWDFEEA